MRVLDREAQRFIVISIVFREQRLPDIIAHLSRLSKQVGIETCFI
jgi:hypothetical protein